MVVAERVTYYILTTTCHTTTTLAQAPMHTRALMGIKTKSSNASNAAPPSSSSLSPPPPPSANVQQSPRGALAGGGGATTGATPATPQRGGAAVGGSTRVQVSSTLSQPFMTRVTRALPTSIKLYAHTNRVSKMYLGLAEFVACMSHAADVGVYVVDFNAPAPPAGSGAGAYVAQSASQPMCDGYIQYMQYMQYLQY